MKLSKNARVRSSAPGPGRARRRVGDTGSPSLVTELQTKVPAATYTGEGRVDLWGGSFAAIGLVGVVVTSVLYGMSPPETALPTMQPDLAAAQAGALAGATTMRAAGMVGMLSDAIYVPGALVLSMGLWRTQPAAAIGRAMLALCGVIFIFVDALVAFALSGAAATPSAQSGFATAKYLFDGLFLVATLVSGAGAFLVYGALSARRIQTIPRWIGWLGGFVAIATMTAAAATLAGYRLGQLTGLSVLAGSALGVVLSLFITASGLRRAA